MSRRKWSGPEIKEMIELKLLEWKRKTDRAKWSGTHTGTGTGTKMGAGEDE